MTKRFFAAALMAACLALPAAAPAAECAPAGGEKIVTTELQALFDAMAAGDAKAWSGIIAPDFYAFDANQRLDGNALFDLVRTAHNAGVEIVWHLDQIDAHVDCDTAWFSLMNHGSVGGAGTSQPVSWQESGVFVYRQGQWRLRFFHSNRVQPKG
jgi:ketosteroid isomerase-like protein